MPTTATRLITADEYFNMPESEAGEWTELVRGVIVPKYKPINGEVKPMPPGMRHGQVQLRIGAKLLYYCDMNRSCRVVTESGVRTERLPDTVRGPDVSLYKTDQLPLNKVVIGYANVPADLCVEVVSPSNGLNELTDKAQEYLQAGVKAVWIADPETRTLTIVTKTVKSQILDAETTIDGGDLLPGFTCKVADLFE